MDIDGFCYELWYISFPIDPINLKLTECTHTVEVNVYTNLKLFGQSKIFMLILGLLANL